MLKLWLIFVFLSYSWAARSKMNFLFLCNIIFFKKQAKTASCNPVFHLTALPLSKKVITQLFPPKALTVFQLGKDSSEARPPSSVFLIVFITRYLKYLSPKPYLICIWQKRGLERLNNLLGSQSNYIKVNLRFWLQILNSYAGGDLRLNLFLWFPLPVC